MKSIEEIMDAIERCTDDSLCREERPYWEDGETNCRANLLNDLRNSLGLEKERKL